jgi:MYXO-CTERM domain-containing protein
LGACQQGVESFDELDTDGDGLLTPGDLASGESAIALLLYDLDGAVLESYYDLSSTAERLEHTQCNTYWADFVPSTRCGTTVSYDFSFGPVELASRYVRRLGDPDPNEQEGEEEEELPDIPDGSRLGYFFEMKLADFPFGAYSLGRRLDRSALVILEGNGEARAGTLHDEVVFNLKDEETDALVGTAVVEQLAWKGESITRTQSRNCSSSGASPANSLSALLLLALAGLRRRAQAPDSKPERARDLPNQRLERAANSLSRSPPFVGALFGALLLSVAPVAAQSPVAEAPPSANPAAATTDQEGSTTPQPAHETVDGSVQIENARLLWTAGGGRKYEGDVESITAGEVRDREARLADHSYLKVVFSNRSGTALQGFSARLLKDHEPLLEFTWRAPKLANGWRNDFEGSAVFSRSGLPESLQWEHGGVNPIPLTMEVTALYPEGSPVAPVSGAPWTLLGMREVDSSLPVVVYRKPSTRFTKSGFDLRHLGWIVPVGVVVLGGIGTGIFFGIVINTWNNSCGLFSAC